MRASDPRPSRSCTGMMHIRAGDIMARRIMSQCSVSTAGSRPRVSFSRRFSSSGGFRFEPALNRIVVVSPGEDHAVFGNVVDGVDIGGRVFRKAEQEHPHAGEAEALHGFADVGGDDPQILGDHRQTDEAVPQFGEEILRGGLHPLPVGGGRFIRGDLPVGHESPEMVDSNVVEQGQISGEPEDPPLITGIAVNVPTVDRVAPELAVGAEVIRWNAGHRHGAAGVVELKKMRVSPHIRAVERHIDGQIPENADPFFRQWVRNSIHCR